ncbi:MAG: thioredoxin fold domain-containing protein [Candidatus Sulfobium sp.]
MLHAYTVTTYFAHLKETAKGASVLCLTLLVLSAPAYASAKNVSLLFFYRPGCRWCRMMDEVIRDPSIKDILRENVSTIMINTAGEEKLPGQGMTGSELARKYRVRGIPTLIFLGPGKQELLRIPGLLTRGDFRDLLCSQVKGINHRLCIRRPETRHSPH